MNIITPKTPTGTLELLPEDQFHFLSMLDTIRAEFEKYGFDNIETPNLENTEILLSKEGGETEKQIYFVQSTGALEANKQNEKKPDMALHFDLTVPLARYVAQHERNLAFPFKRYQIQRVYRGERAQKGRFREFYQCDIDIVGRDTLHHFYDTEILNVIFETFKALNVGYFKIYINNRKFLRGLFEHFDITSSELQAHILREVDKGDKIGFEQVRVNLVQNNLLDDQKAADLLAILNHDLSKPNAEILASLSALNIENDIFKEGISEMKDILQNLSIDNSNEEIKINLSIARGLDYYTGIVYETILIDHPEFGSVCSGGRYDNLVSKYSKQKFPGVGISIGATRLFNALHQTGHYEKSTNNSYIDAIILPQSHETLSYCREIAQKLREEGGNIDLYLDPHPLKKQMKYADKKKIAFAIIVGEDEMSNGTVTRKDLKTGEQQIVKVNDLTSIIKK